MVAVFDSIISIILRVGELAFAAVVAGLTGEYLHSIDNVSASDKKRFIYTEVVAGLGMFLALLWLIPFTSTFIHWPVDLLLFVLFMIAFGLLVQFIGPLDCGSVFYWGDITQKGTCQKWKADVAFTFLSAIFWLASAILGLWYVHRHRRGVKGHAVAGDGIGTNTAVARRRWYRRY